MVHNVVWTNDRYHLHSKCTVCHPQIVQKPLKDLVMEKNNPHQINQENRQAKVPQGTKGESWTIVDQTVRCVVPISGGDYYILGDNEVICGRNHKHQPI